MKMQNSDKRYYRLACVLRPDVSASKAKKIFDELLQLQADEIIKSDYIGISDLAYPMYHFKQGHRFFADLYIEPENIKALNLRFNVNESVLRNKILRLNLDPTVKHEAIFSNPKAMLDMTYTFDCDKFLTPQGKISFTRSSKKYSFTQKRVIAKIIKRQRYMGYLAYIRKDGTLNDLFSVKISTKSESSKNNDIESNKNDTQSVQKIN